MNFSMWIIPQKRVSGLKKKSIKIDKENTFHNDVSNEQGDIIKICMWQITQL